MQFSPHLNGEQYVKFPEKLNLLDIFPCMSGYDSRFSQGIRNCLNSNSTWGIYQGENFHILDFVQQFKGLAHHDIPHLTLSTDLEEVSVGSHHLTQVFHEMFGFCFTLNSKLWHR